MDPATLVPIALGVGGIASNIFSNDRQQQNFERQMQFQKYQYEDSKRYNSAQEQVKRLRAAGINPSLAFGQNAGMAQAVSEPAAPSYTPLDMNGLSSIASNVSLLGAQKANLEADTKKKDEEAVRESINNKWLDEDWKSKIFNRDQDSLLKEKHFDLAKLAIEFDTKSMRDRLRKQHLDAELADCEVAAQTITMQYIVPEKAAQINSYMATAASAYMNGRASLKQAHAALMSAVSNSRALKAQYGNTDEERKKYFNASLDFLIQQKATYESQERKNDRIQGRFNANSPLLSIGYDQFGHYDKHKRKYVRD